MIAHLEQYNWIISLQVNGSFKAKFFPMLVIMYRIQVGMPFLVLSILPNLPETIIFIEALQNRTFK